MEIRPRRSLRMVAHKGGARDASSSRPSSLSSSSLSLKTFDFRFVHTSHPKLSVRIEHQPSLIRSLPAEMASAPQGCGILLPKKSTSYVLIRTLGTDELADEAVEAKYGKNGLILLKTLQAGGAKAVKAIWPLWPKNLSPNIRKSSGSDTLVGVVNREDVRQHEDTSGGGGGGSSSSDGLVGGEGGRAVCVDLKMITDGSERPAKCARYYEGLQ